MKNVITAVLFMIGLTAMAQSSEELKGLMKDAEKAKMEMLEKMPELENELAGAEAYVILPNIGKGAFIVGGASGRGIVYENGKAVGMTHMKQADVGIQFGGKAYRELIIFKDADKYQEFKDDDFSFSAQASAVVLKTGASAHAKNMDGVSVYIQPKAGLMIDASIGGQKFDFEKM